MTRINVNLNDVESSFEVYPDGQYFVEIKSSKVQQGENSTYIRWIAEILEGEYAGKLVSWNTSLAPNALWNLKKMLEAVGAEWDEEGFDDEDVYGGRLIVVNEVQVYEGTERNNIKDYLKAE